jgi:hypothetical protein
MSIMIKILLPIIGLLIVVGAVAAAWKGFEKVDDVRRLEQSIYVQRSQNAYGRSEEAKESGEKKIVEFEQGIETKKTERNIWFGVAAAALVAGLGIALVPSSRKSKNSVATTAPAQIEDAPGT